MAKIGELLVEVTAGTSGLREEMRKAKGVVEKESKAIQNEGKGMAQVFDMSGKKVSGFRDDLKKLNEPLEGVRSALGAVGVAGTEAVGVVGQLAQGFANVGGKAGVIGAGLVGVGFAISQIVEHMEEADRLAAKERILGLDPDLLDELNAKFPELERSSVVALAAAGKEAGLTKGDIVRLGEAARDEAEMSGKAFDENLSAALKRVGVTADQVRSKTRTFLSDFFGQQAGDTSQFNEAEFNKNLDAITRSEEVRDAAQKRIDEISRGEVGGTQSFLDRERARLEGVVRDTQRHIDDLQATVDAMLDAKEEIEGVLGDNKPGDNKPRARVGSRRAGNLPNVYAALSDGEFDSLPGASLGNAEDLLNAGLAAKDADDTAAAEAQRKADEARFEQIRLDGVKLGELHNDQADDAAKAWQEAGLSAAGQFASAFRQYLDSKDPKDLFGSFLQVAGSILSIIPGVSEGAKLGGGLLKIAGGFFAEGGHVRGPGTATSDSIPAMLSDGEYVLRASAVKRLGVGVLDRLNNMQSVGSAISHFASGGVVGRGGNGASIGGNTFNNFVMAFDAPTIERNSTRLESVQHRRITNRQGAGLQEAVRHSVMTPRWA